MTTANETMKDIAKGIDKKEEPKEAVMEGKIIAIEVPDELAEMFDGLIGSLLSKDEVQDAEETENNQNNGDDLDDEDGEPTEAQRLAWDIAGTLGCRASDHLMLLKEKNGLSTEAMLTIVKCLLGTGSERLVSMLRAIFLSNGMDAAASELDLLDICSEYDEDAVFFFEDPFWDTDAMDWYSIENLLRDKTREQNSKLN